MNLIRRILSVALVFGLTLAPVSSCELRVSSPETVSGFESRVGTSQGELATRNLLS